MITFVRN